RRVNPALRYGDFTVLLADENVLAVRRVAGQQAIAAVFNLSAEPIVWPAVLTLNGAIVAAVNGATIGDLPPYGALWIEISC
ncbi:DUF3459 domain-containing protein, partial [Novosphingobium sp.]